MYTPYESLQRPTTLTPRRCRAPRAQDSDKEISFTEFLHMDQKNDLAGTSKHPGFRLSAGMLATTKEENKRLLRQMGVAK